MQAVRRGNPQRDRTVTVFPESNQTKPFRHDGNRIMVRLHNGPDEIVVAEAKDKYWADAIAYALNIDHKA